MGRAFAAPVYIPEAWTHYFAGNLALPLLCFYPANIFPLAQDAAKGTWAVFTRH